MPPDVLWLVQTGVGYNPDGEVFTVMTIMQGVKGGQILRFPQEGNVSHVDEIAAETDDQIAAAYTWFAIDPP